MLHPYISLHTCIFYAFVYISQSRCGSCAVWKTRVLISRAVVPLITPHNAKTVLDSVLRKLNTCSQNSLHTALLILHRLVVEGSDLLESVKCTEFGADLCVWLLDNLLNRWTIGSK